MDILDNKFEEISSEELVSIEGGFILAYALIYASIGVVGAAVAAGYQGGYDAMDELLSE